MQTLFEVHGDHPTLRRIDEYKMTEVESNDLMAELAKHGYENLTRSYSIVYEEGDEVLITEQMYEASDKLAKEQVNYMFKKIFPIKGVVKAERLNRHCGDLSIEWENMSDHWASDNITNTHWLAHEEHGFNINFIQPIFDELEILTCPDKWLDEEEMVVKYYALQNNVTIEEAQKVIDKVETAMSQRDIVFYRP